MKAKYLVGLIGLVVLAPSIAGAIPPPTGISYNGICYSNLDKFKAAFASEFGTQFFGTVVSSDPSFILQKVYMNLTQPVTLTGPTALSPNINGFPDRYVLSFYTKQQNYKADGTSVFVPPSPSPGILVSVSLLSCDPPN
jgi:hypothetical protein